MDLKMNNYVVASSEDCFCSSLFIIIPCVYVYIVVVVVPDTCYTTSTVCLTIQKIHLLFFERLEHIAWAL